MNLQELQTIITNNLPIKIFLINNEGYPYFCARSNKEMSETVDKILELPGYVFCEIFTDTEQIWEPKSSTKRLEDGRLVSPPLEDLAPFLSREELAENMFIDMIEE